MAQAGVLWATGLRDDARPKPRRNMRPFVRSASVLQKRTQHFEAPAPAPARTQPRSGGRRVVRSRTQVPPPAERRQPRAAPEPAVTAASIQAPSPWYPTAAHTAAVVRGSRPAHPSPMRGYVRPAAARPAPPRREATPPRAYDPPPGVSSAGAARPGRGRSPHTGTTTDASWLAAAPLSYSNLTAAETPPRLGPAWVPVRVTPTGIALGAAEEAGGVPETRICGDCSAKVAGHWASGVSATKPVLADWAACQEQARDAAAEAAALAAEHERFKDAGELMQAAGYCVDGDPVARLAGIVQQQYAAVVRASEQAAQDAAAAARAAAQAAYYETLSGNLQKQVISLQRALERATDGGRVACASPHAVSPHATPDRPESPGWSRTPPARPAGTPSEHAIGDRSAPHPARPHSASPVPQACAARPHASPGAARRSPNGCSPSRVVKYVDAARGTQLVDIRQPLSGRTSPYRTSPAARRLYGDVKASWEEAAAHPDAAPEGVRAEDAVGVLAAARGGAGCRRGAASPHPRDAHRSPPAPSPVPSSRPVALLDGRVSDLQGTADLHTLPADPGFEKAPLLGKLELLEASVLSVTSGSASPVEYGHLLKWLRRIREDGAKLDGELQATKAAKREADRMSDTLAKTLAMWPQQGPGGRPAPLSRALLEAHAEKARGGGAPKRALSPKKKAVPTSPDSGLQRAASYSVGFGSSSARACNLPVSPNASPLRRVLSDLSGRSSRSGRGRAAKSPGSARSTSSRGSRSPLSVPEEWSVGSSPALGFGSSAARPCNLPAAAAAASPLSRSSSSRSVRSAAGASPLSRAASGGSPRLAPLDAARAAAGPPPAYVSHVASAPTSPTTPVSPEGGGEGVRSVTFSDGLAPSVASEYLSRGTSVWSESPAAAEIPAALVPKQEAPAVAAAQRDVLDFMLVGAGGGGGDAASPASAPSSGRKSRRGKKGPGKRGSESPGTTPAASPVLSLSASYKSVGGDTRSLLGDTYGTMNSMQFAFGSSVPRPCAVSPQALPVDVRRAVPVQLPASPSSSASTPQHRHRPRDVPVVPRLSIPSAGPHPAVCAVGGAAMGSRASTPDAAVLTPRAPSEPLASPASGDGSTQRLRSSPYLSSISPTKLPHDGGGSSGSYAAPRPAARATSSPRGLVSPRPGVISPRPGAKRDFTSEVQALAAREALLQASAALTGRAQGGGAPAAAATTSPRRPRGAAAPRRETASSASKRKAPAAGAKGRGKLSTKKAKAKAKEKDNEEGRDPLNDFRLEPRTSGTEVAAPRRAAPDRGPPLDAWSTSDNAATAATAGSLSTQALGLLLPSPSPSSPSPTTATEPQGPTGGSAAAAPAPEMATADRALPAAQRAEDSHTTLTLGEVGEPRATPREAAEEAEQEEAPPAHSAAFRGTAAPELRRAPSRDGDGGGDLSKTLLHHTDAGAPDGAAPAAAAKGAPARDFQERLQKVRERAWEQNRLARLTCVHDLVSLKARELRRTERQLVQSLAHDDPDARRLLASLGEAPDGSVPRDMWLDWFYEFPDGGPSPDHVVSYLLQDLAQLNAAPIPGLPDGADDASLVSHEPSTMHHHTDSWMSVNTTGDADDLREDGRSAPKDDRG